MKTITRVLAFLLALMMFLPVLAACGSKTKTSDDGNTTPSSPVSGPETPSEEVDIDIGPTTNVALNKPTYANGGKDLSANVTDGDANTAWTAGGVPKYVEVDLQTNHMIKEVNVKIPKGAVQGAYNVYASTDGVNFKRLGAMTEMGTYSKDGFNFYLKTPVVARVVRVMQTMSSKGSGSSSIVSEIEVMGITNDTPVTPTRTSIEIPSYDEWLLKNHNFDLSKIKDKDGKYDINKTFTTADTVKALEGLVTRILGEQYVSWFSFEVAPGTVNKNDYYEISDKSGKIHIKGNTGVSIATGLNYYLKYYCKVNVSQETKQVDMPKSVVKVGSTIKRETPYTVRYTYNYCTLSYTMPYYGYDEWQRELDYLMLSGINVVLDTTATEALWVLYLQNYGYTVQEAIEFVCGYTWKAWWLMGNLEGYGGPVGDNWIVDTVELARVNQRYLTVMGADLCLQTFVGTMPTDFGTKAQDTLAKMGYPNLNDYMTSTSTWCGFLRPYALNTTFSGFEELAETFYETQNHIYGRVNDYYAGDLLHEINAGFKLPDSFDKAKMSRTVLDLLLEENPNGIWIIQSWWENPLPDVVAGWGDDREDHMLLLDLAAVHSPRWSDTTRFGGREFGGSSWCYCILESYGGRSGMHINLQSVATKFYNTKKEAKHLKGIGLTSESTERNPVVFDLFWEMVWEKKEINVESWIEDYAERRYRGGDHTVDVWKRLLKCIYNSNTPDGTTINYLINNYPQLAVKDPNGYFYPGYKNALVESAIKNLLADYDKLKDQETYVYDVVDICRTYMSNVTTEYIDFMLAAGKKGDYETFHAYKTRFLQALMIIDELSDFTEKARLGKWIGRVDTWVNDERTATYSDFDVDLMKLDAYILITNWSTLDLNNYANRQISGLMSDYYYVMWEYFLNTIVTPKVKAGGKNVTNGGLGVNSVVTYYNMGRALAISGKTFDPNPTPVNGDADSRSLKEVVTEIKDRFFTNCKVELNTAAPKADSGVTVANGTVSGLPAGITAGEASKLFATTEGGKVVFCKGKKPVEDTVAVTSDLIVHIMEDDGSILELGWKIG
jgi:hypothetical protein